MATTIARLSAVLTTDTNQFQFGLQRAGQQVQQFSKRSESTTGVLSKLQRQFIQTSGSFGRFTGIVGTLAGVAGPIGLVVATLSAATVAATAFIVKLAQIGDASRDPKIESLRDLFQAYDELKGTKFSVGFEMKTNKELTDDIRRSVGDLAEGLGLTLKPILMALSDVVDQINIRILGEDMAASLKASHDSLQRQIERTKELRAQAKQRADEEKQAIAEIQNELEQSVNRMASKAEQLRQSLRSPIEVMREAFQELDRLRSGGYINDDTLRQGLKAAAGDFFEASKKLMDAKNQLASPVGALERGTTAEFSSRVRATLETQRLEAIGREQARLQREAVVELQKLNSKAAQGVSVMGL